MSVQRKEASESLLKKYLVLYNTVEAVLWFSVIGRVLLVGHLTSQSTPAPHDSVSTFLRLVQTSAILEVVHVALGWVPSPLFTTITQVTSRLLLVWGIDYLFPEVVRHSNAFLSMVVAWSITEILRYSYYAINMQAQVPQIMVWLRYTLFYVLYPLGAGSECWLVYQSLDKARQLSPLYAYSLKAILLVYIPGFYTLYTYMIAQRRKMMKRQGKKALK